MIDITVAWDKLSNFESADEIAEFFKDQSIKAEMGNSWHCAISQWMQDTTGDTKIITTENSIGKYGMSINGYEQFNMIHEHTPAMEEFVARFDEGQYPELVISCICDNCTGRKNEI